MTIRWMTMASMIMALGAFAACGCGDDDDDDAGGDDDTSDDDGDDDDTEPGDDDVDDDDVDDDVDDDTGDDDTGPPPDDYLAPWPQSNIESHPYDESPTAGDIRMKAEAYNEWIEDNYLPDYGGHVHVKYTDDTLTTPLYYHGFGDSGMWTGVFGATQAMRYHATGSLTAKENAIRMIYALINNVHVTGRPGFTARYRAPKTSLIYSYYGGDAWCDGDENCHHIESGEYAGDFWIGNTSRDMYIGWYFGMAMVYDLIDDDELRQDIRDIVIDLTDGLIDNYWWIVDVDGHPTTKGPNILPPMRLTWSLIAYHITGEERFGDIVRKWLRDEHRQELTTASITFFNHYADYYGNNLAHTNWYNLLRLGKVYFSPEDYAFFLDLFDTEVHTFTRLSHNPWFNGFFMSTDLYTPTKDDPFQDQLIEDLDTFQDPPMRFYFLPARTGWDPDPVSVILYNLMQQYPWLEVLAGGSWKIIADEPFPVDQQCSAGFMFQWNPYDVDDCGTDDPSNTHSGHDFLAAYWLGTYLGFVTKDM